MGYRGLYNRLREPQIVSVAKLKGKLNSFRTGYQKKRFRLNGTSMKSVTYPWTRDAPRSHTRLSRKAGTASLPAPILEVCTSYGPEI